MGLLTFFQIDAQNTLRIADGNVKILDTTKVVLQNTQWVNNGTFSAGSGTVIITGNGTDAQSAIGGDSITTFHNVIINKTSNGSQLQQDIQVDSVLRLMGGTLDLNGKNLTLGSAHGIIEGETEANRITGTTGGVISKTISLNAPSNANPGNLGLIITSAADLGSTTIKRGHQAQSIGGSNGVHRYYEVAPASNSGLNAEVQFQYLEAELNGIAEADLGFWRQDSAFWFNRTKDAANAPANFVRVNSQDLLSKYTLAPDAPQLSIKVNLQGPYSSANSNMGDGLRSNSRVPTGEPYTDLGYQHVSVGGAESINPAVFDINDNNAIVDWVFVELRSSSDNKEVLAARSALLQKDGDIVELDGTSPLSFPGIANGGSYFIVVHHRNHLAVMTTNPVDLTPAN